MKLYNDIEKELTLSDWQVLPDLKALSYDDIVELWENLYDVLENTYLYHSDLLQIAIYQDIHKVEIHKKMKELKMKKAGII